MKNEIKFKAYQDQLKKILLFFDTLCRENNINYTVLDGTLLGAVRHKGFIPWDADVDVALTPKEFEKLKLAFQKYSGRYYLTYIPNHGYKKKGRKHDFLSITAKIIDKKCTSSIFGIDVFTIDFLGNDLKFAKDTIKKYKRYSFLQRFTSAFHIPEGKWTIKKTLTVVFYPFFKLISYSLTPYFEKKYLKFRKSRIESNNEDCRYFTIEPYVGRINVLENTILIGGYIDMPFEDIKVMAVKNYDDYLIPTYGNYMELPLKDKRIPYPSEEIITECQFEE